MFLFLIIAAVLTAALLAEGKLYHALPQENAERARSFICELARDFDEGSSFVRWDTSCCFPVANTQSYVVSAWHKGHKGHATGVPRGVPGDTGHAAGVPQNVEHILDDIQRAFAHWRDILANKGGFSVYFVTNRKRMGGKEEFGNNSNFCLDQRELSHIYKFLKCDDSLFTSSGRTAYGASH